MHDYVTMILNAVPVVLGLLLLAFLLIGFWRGLTLRPHKEGHRPAQHPTWWWYHWP